MGSASYWNSVPLPFTTFISAIHHGHRAGVGLGNVIVESVSGMLITES
jgi:hypothetical protein